MIAINKTVEKHDRPLPDFVIYNISAGNSASLIQKLSNIISEKSKITNIDSEELFNNLLNTEKNCQCGIGDGIAFPHIKLRNIDKPYTIFAKLEKPVALNSTDNKPIDILYMLISPEKDGPAYLRQIAAISRKLKDKNFIDMLRNADCEDALISIFAGHNNIDEKQDLNINAA